MQTAAVWHPEFGGPVLMTVEARPANDEAATEQTIRRMAQYVREDSLSPIVRRAALDATATAPPCPRRRAETIFDWIRRRVRFVQDSRLAGPVSDDPEGAEVLVRPVDVLTMPEPKGDCDDFAMLCAALLRAVGIASCFVTVAADQTDPERYSHVYVLALLPGGALPLDPSHGPYPGWEVRAIGKKRAWPIEGPMQHLGALPSWAVDIIKTGVEAGTEIAKERYGQPPPGTYRQTTDAGAIVYRQPAGAAPLAFPGAQISFGGTSGILLILGAVALLLLITRR